MGSSWSEQGRGSRRGHAPQRRRRGLGAALAALALCLGGAPPSAWAQGASVVDATEADKARAQDLYKGAAMSFEFRRFEDALAKFRASYAVVRSPNTHLMIARSLVELGRKREAFEELTVTISEAQAAGERYADAAAKATELRSALSAEVAVLTVDVRPGSEPEAVTVLVGGKDLPRERWGIPMALDPAEIEVVGRFHGAERQKQQIALAAGKAETVVIDLSAPGEAPPPAPRRAAVAEPAEPERPSSPLVPLAAISAGVGAGGLAVFTVFGLMNQSTYDALEKRCAEGCAPADVQERVDEGKTQQTVANVGLVVGAVGLTAAATLVVLELAREDAPASNGARITRLGVGPAGVRLDGAF